MSPESKNNPRGPGQRSLNRKAQSLWLRARMVQAIRQFFVEKDYLEVETPHIIPAPPPEIHIDAVSAGKGFLHTSPEVCMKRLLSAGFPKIFQISRCFRSDERGNTHLPEFSLLEWYRTGIEYHALMDECRELILWLSEELGMDGKISYQGRQIDLKRSWTRMSVSEAFDLYASMTLEKALETCSEDQMLNELLARKFPDFNYNSAPAKERRRVVHFLQRRGFTISQVMEQLTRKGFDTSDEDRQ